MRQKSVYIINGQSGGQISQQDALKTFSWIVRRLYQIQNQRNLKIFDQNGDEISDYLEEEAKRQDWEQIKSDYLSLQAQDGEEIQDFEKNALDEIQQQKGDLQVLERVFKQQKSKVLNLRTQIDEIESQNSRVVQEEQNYKKLYAELKQLTNYIKIDNSQQSFLLKGADFNDDSQIQQIVQILDNLKLSLQDKSITDIQYTQDMNASLLKLKQKVIIRFTEAISKRLKKMEQDKISQFGLISKDFVNYLGKREPILAKLAEISICQTQKGVYHEINGLLNRFYRVISEEFSQFMQNKKFQELKDTLKQDIVGTYKLDLPSKQPKSLQNFLCALTKDQLKKSESSTLDVDVGKFCIELLQSIQFFESVFFNFFECGEMQLLKDGDKSFNQFIEICLQDLYDQQQQMIGELMKINPFTLYTIASLAQIICESMQKKKVKRQLTKYILKNKTLDFKSIKNLFFQEIYQKLSESALQAFQDYITSKQEDWQQTDKSDLDQVML
ncbi:UNKNOWN [Stylonychia lemnae]|uniref:Exocyst complex component Sec3 coiled-coil domain-containing protein n=1 Tax=Stylonychia lemnae TaxID=5949 RepID=A0A078B1U5_STYLE|nr:UNKNOWN [Stylonychia lemnae]|eukprot:CDW88474.1 UNKNOWN [Stylonychia lemnae]